MRKLVAAYLLSTATAAFANPTPDLVPAPSWVTRVPVKIPTDTTEAPVRVLLSDQQMNLTPGAISHYNENAILIQNANGLSAGNLAIAWRPDIDTMAIHALTLTRKGKVIDVLAKQKFTVIRRETNLEDAALDGRLTATMIVEGVEVGDVLTLASSITSRDPTWGNHVEGVVAQWNGVPIEQAHSRLHWTRDIPLRVKASPGLPAVTTASDATGKYIEVSAEHVQPLIPPKAAPLRFRLGRFIQTTDYKNWSDLSARFEPLFAKASTIDPKGALAQRIDAIRSESADPLARATTALALTQDNVRYVALFMGEGGYLPAQADATWANRLGDCKAKTALLLAMLHRLDIPAVAVLVGSRGGDGIDEQLPSIGAFDHVLVRATIKGRDYWLDGTRTGDRDLARIETPNFHWGLPLVPAAQLVRMVPPPHSQPDMESVLNIDARKGIYAPAKAHAEAIFRADEAQGIKTSLSSLSDAARDNALREYWKGRYDFIQPDKVSASFDPATGIEKVTLDGTAQIKVDDSWIRVPGSGLAFSADFTRPAGPGQDAPFVTSYPNYARTETTITLPGGVDLWDGKIGHDVDETLAGVAYHREAKLADNVLRMVASERAVVPEVTAAAARSVQARLRALDGEDVQLQVGQYSATDADLTALAATTPDTAEAYLNRGILRLNRDQFAEAIEDLTKSHSLDPKDEWALANRGIAHAHLGHSAEAEADFVAASAIDSHNAVVARGRALLAAKRGDTKAALAHLSASLATDPNNVYALKRRVEVNQSLGNLAEAVADTDTLLKVSDDIVEIRLMRANLFKAQGRKDQVIAEAEAIQRVQPSDVDAQVTAARIYDAMGQRDRAMAAYDHALQTKPSAFVYLNRSLSRPRTEIAARRADLDAALKLEPAQEDALFASASLAAEQRDFPRAIADYSSIIGKNPKAAFALAARGVTYLQAGNATAAKRDFDAAVAADSSPSLLNAICWDKATHNVALPSALADCNRAIAASPNSAAILDSRGFVNLRLGNIDAAIADFDAALKITPTLPASLYGRSVAYARKGNQAASAADLKSAVSFSPDIVDTYRGYGVEPVSAPAPAKTASATH